ncbi:MAG: hypothetical protein KKG02_10610 [Candidatus Edwardsbacteria bacterium]|nr:hypothetical protein [Candidatus Edwardsbacteria bacterium]
MKWKCLFVIFKNIDVKVDKWNFKDSFSNTALKAINKAINDFAGQVKANTGNVVELEYNTPKEIDKLNFLTNNKGAGSTIMSPLVSDNDFIRAMQRHDGTWNLDYNEYDSIFTIFPGRKSEGIADIHLAHLSYYMSLIKGATFHSMIGDLTSNLALEKNKGEAFMHEWLHGVCYFFEGYDWPMPDRQSDGAGVYHYKEWVDERWNEFYKDIMLGRVYDKTNTAIKGIGIPKDKWKISKPSDPSGLIGYNSKNAGKFQSAYKGQKGAIQTYNKSKMIRALKNVEIQLFDGPYGNYAIMCGKNRKAFVVPPEFWKKYDDKKIDMFPMNDKHLWGDGNIQDFETNDGWHGGIMQKFGSNDIYIVSGNIWKAYVKTEGIGAKSYLKYPIRDEYVGVANGENYYVQKFEGGWCWAMTKSPWKCGNDKQWGTKKPPK